MPPSLDGHDSDSFRALLPSCVAVQETTEDPATATLFDSERAYVAKAVERRRLEFTTVRHCARLALGQLGFAPSPIPPGKQREPLWPTAVVGSMTHCEGYRAAAVSRSDQTLTIGIDAEVNGPLPDGVLDLVTDDDEARALQIMTTWNPTIAWDRLLFSAKEAVYKAWYPLTGRWLDFDQCTVAFGRGKLFARLRGVNVPDGTPDQFHGNWARRGRHLLTAVHIPAPGSRPTTRRGM